MLKYAYKVNKKGVIKIGNEIQNVDMRTPIEIALQIDENGHTTARALYEFLELGQGQFSRWSKTNIEKNEFYEENVDWWGFDIVSNGNNCKDYKLTTDFAKHLCMESIMLKERESTTNEILKETAYHELFDIFGNLKESDTN